MSIRSPKARFRASVTLDKARGNIGGDSYTSDSLEEVRHFAELFARGEAAHIEIKENLKKYPEFEWVTVESYNVNGK